MLAQGSLPEEPILPPATGAVSELARAPEGEGPIPVVADVEAPDPMTLPTKQLVTPLSLEAAVQTADLVAFGQITGPAAEIEETGEPGPAYTFQLLTTYKGNANAGRLEVVDPRTAPTATFTETVAFAAGETYVLFLHELPGFAGYELLAGADVLPVDPGMRLPSGEALDVLEGQIHSLLDLGEPTFAEEVTSEIFPDYLTLPQVPSDDEKPGVELTPTPPTDPDKATQTLLQEGFEGAFPGAWNVFDNDGTANGQVFWDDTSFRSYLGSWSAWCADGGANASPPGGNYSNNMQSWMVYGPFNLSDAIGGTFSFRFWNNSELNFDFFKYLVSINGSNFYGTQVSGNSGGWLSRTVDLTNVPTLGDVTGDSSVWIAFVFTSDSSITNLGAYVDEVQVQKTTGSPADLDLQLIDAPSGTFAPGDSITVQNLTRNVGGEASTSYRITFYASTNTTITTTDRSLGFVDRGGLAAGAAHSFATTMTLPSDLAAGNYYIGAILTISDASSANNVNHDPTPLTVATVSPADLDLQLIDAPTGTFAPGDSITVQNLIRNVGGLTSPGYRITFYASTNTLITTTDRSLGFVDRGALAAAGVHNFNTTMTLPSDLADGTYYIGAILTVSDASSANNVNHDPTPLTVATLPQAADLDLELIDAPSGTFAPGGSITVQNLTRNVGGVTSPSYRITFYASTNTLITTTDRSLGFVDRGALAAAGVHNFNTTMTLPSDLADGTYYIGAILTVADANSANNVNHDPTPLTVATPPSPADLDLELVDAPSGTFAPGDSITVQNLTRNIGGVTSPSYRITFYASTDTLITTTDRSLGFVDRGALAAAGVHNFNTTMTLPADLTGGTYYVGAILTVTDASSANNVNHDPTPLTVATSSLPDIRIQPTTLTFTAPGAASKTAPQAGAQILLKDGSFLPREDHSAVFPTPRHLLIQFEGPPRDETLAALRSLGVEIVLWVPRNAVAARVPADTSLAALPGIRWVGALEPQAKLSANLQKSLSGGMVLVDFYPGVTASRAREVIEATGGRVIDNAYLRPRTHLVAADLDVLTGLAMADEVNWLRDAPEIVTSGEPFFHCPGALTSVGPVADFVAHDDGWDGPGLGPAALTYHFDNGTADISGTLEEAEVERAFQEWSRHAAITWTETAASRLNRSLDISWVRGDHGDGSPFDGPGSVLAHAFYPSPPNPETIAGDMHFDDDELWQIGAGFDLFSIALHEAGHAIGLNHSENPSAVMKPTFSSGERFIALTQDDINGILSIYAPVTGSGSGTFTIWNDGSADLSVTSMALATSGPWISWSPQAPFTVPRGGSRTVTVTVDFASAPQGSSSRRLLVSSNDPDESPYPGGVFINVDTGQTTCHVLTRTHTGQGTDPTASPPSSAGCPSGQYQAGEVITLSAGPAAGWSVGSWTGTNNDASTSTQNSLTMPAGAHTVSVRYVEIPPTCHLLTRTHTGQGTDPTASPASSAGCPSGQYQAGQAITLSAGPAAGWNVGSWTGTSNDASTATTNTATMPDRNHTVGVNYVTTGSCAATRALPPGYAPSQPSAIRIDVTPSNLTQVYAVEETPPAGWTVSGVDNGGVFDSSTGTVKWGPFFDNLSRSLNYSVTPPTGTSGSFTFSGVLSVDGNTESICGDTQLDPATLHPADLSDDWRMRIDEVTAYGAAWKTGSTWQRPPNPIPINYVTNAGFLWKVGEVYHFDAAQDPPWAPGSGASLGKARAKVSGTAVAILSAREYTPGLGVQVTILVTPGNSTQVYAVQDGPPNGWTISGINELGAYDAVNGLVKWGPFFDNAARTLVYTVMPPPSATGSHRFSGVSSFDGASVVISGDRTVFPANTLIFADGFESGDTTAW